MGDSDKVFPNLKFDTPNNTKLRSWAYKSGVKKHITPHSARHSFAFFMLDRHNTPLYTLSKILVILMQEPQRMSTTPVSREY